MIRLHSHCPRVLAPLFVLAISSTLAAQTTQPIATVEQAIASKTDLWGDAALHQPGGPSYEFFEKIVPPLRYVDANFHEYPFVLSAPNAAVKARYVSNGSGINLHGDMPTWSNETGTPIEVHLGNSRELFGADPDRLDGPHYVDGYLPIIQNHYKIADDHFGEECFASVDDKLASAGTVLLKIDFPGVDQNRVDLWFDEGHDVLPGRDGLVKDKSGKVLAAFDDNWQWIASRSILLSKEKHAASAYVAIFTQPIEASDAPKVTEDFYNHQRQLAVARWNDILKSGTQIEVPEARINNAWRSLITQQYEILLDDHMNYSALNQYQRQYAHESGEAMRGLLYFGHGATAAKTIKPIFEYVRKGILFHDGAFKLMDLADYYFMTRDAQLVRDLRPLWQHELDLIMSSRNKETGLLPPERYCSDVPHPVVSISTNASCWRGVRDMSNVLADMGETEEAQKLANFAQDFRKSILALIDKSWIRDVDPPFLPLAPSIETKPIDPITGTTLSSYWNLVIPQFLNAEIIPYNSQGMTDVLHYMQQNGGLCMGMIRFQSPRATWVNEQNIDDLYTLRYALMLQKRDEVDRALVSFYGKLAQGFTRDTFLDGEVTSIVPVDSHGRQISLPPNSHANASFLLQLRYLLVQDWDMNDDGRADTLRLLFGTPRRWLEDGKQIRIERAPTAFGDVSLKLQSNVAKGAVTIDVDLPKTAPGKTLLRIRLPEGHKLVSAKAGDQNLPIDADVIDLSKLPPGHVTISATVQ